MSFWPGEKLVEKMWETLAEKGVGYLLKPWQTIREGNAQVEVRRREMLALAQAEADAADIKAGRKRLQKDGTLLAIANGDDSNVLVLCSTDGRTEPTLNIDKLVLDAAATNVADHVRREVNVARAVIMTEEILIQDSKDPPEATIEDDWLSTWREHVGRISSEELQRLWASVLAGEIKAPGTYSLRTLEFLRTLSKAEAEKIARLASFVIDGAIIVRNVNAVFEANQIRFSTWLEMQELGILTGVEALGLTMTYPSADPNRFVKGLVSHGKVLVIEREGQHELKINVYMLTTLGKEIMSLGKFSANVDYLVTVGRQFVSEGFKVQLAEILEENETNLTFGNAAAITAA